MAHIHLASTSPEEVSVQFTAFCTICGGIQMLSNLTHQEDEPSALLPKHARTP
jgi:hypothetical protein